MQHFIQIITQSTSYLVKTMVFREATPKDIGQIQLVRNAVKENRLSDPGLVTDKDCEEYLTVRGKGWVCEMDGRIIGFSIAGVQSNNIWALFVHPEHEGKGIGKNLHRLMLDWYFEQTKETVWLSTAPGTRAEEFYKKAGWQITGAYGKGEIKFEMKFSHWMQLRANENPASLTEHDTVHNKVYNKCESKFGNG